MLLFPCPTSWPHYLVERAAPLTACFFVFCPTTCVVPLVRESTKQTTHSHSHGANLVWKVVREEGDGTNTSGRLQCCRLFSSLAGKRETAVETKFSEEGCDCRLGLFFIQKSAYYVTRLLHSAIKPPMMTGYTYVCIYIPD